MYAAGAETPEAFLGFCEELKNRDNIIEDAKAKLAEIDANKGSSATGNVCSCGHTNDDGAAFCANCGKQLK